MRDGDPIEVSADGRFACRRHLDDDVKRQLVVADYLTDTVTRCPSATRSRATRRRR
jgi:hypothetical protein